MLPLIKTYLKRHVPALIKRHKGRAEQLEDELYFWDRWFKKRGLQWPEDYRNRLNPNLPLAEEYRELINHLPQDEVRILDVGAGPLTVLGKKHPSKRLLLAAVDVLAERYDELLDRYGIQPIVRTEYADAEKLAERFPQNSFDLVNARNCLDHTADPIEAVRQILFITKKDCFALLHHAENEGETQGYSGLHQWNFTARDGNFIIEGAGVATNISTLFGRLADFQCSIKNGWIRVYIRKK
ncbi:MAG TPA: methyltransferase domain-containing protein [Pyrinomonadaceae bacterium]